MSEPDALEEALRQPAKFVYFEPLTNPRNEVLDTESLCAIAHAAGAMVVVDNTFLSP